MLPGLSAYMTSKLAQTKRIEFVSPENPSVFAATVHPSMVVTDMFNKSGGKEEALAMDKSKSHSVFYIQTRRISSLATSPPFGLDV